MPDIVDGSDRMYDQSRCGVSGKVKSSVWFEWLYREDVINR